MKIRRSTPTALAASMASHHQILSLEAVPFKGGRSSSVKRLGKCRWPSHPFILYTTASARGGGCEWRALCRRRCDSQQTRKSTPRRRPAFVFSQRKSESPRYGQSCQRATC
jgi:hypothetical protein